MKQLTKYSWAMMLILVISLSNACKKDTTEPQVIASFTFAVDANNFKIVTFTNTAQNFQKLSWNFGDNSALSAELNPTHTYATLGDFTVTLTATSPGGNTDIYSTKITIADPNAQLTKLVGDVSKTWKLIRTSASGRYPLEVGPQDHSTIWWAMGKDNNELANRPCLLNDEWTFGRDGSLVYNANGDYWAEAGIYAAPGNVCANTADPMVGANGEDLSAWGSGNHTFTMTTGATPTITAVGKGAFIGFIKLADGIEVQSTNPIVVPTSVTYNIVKLTDDAVDTLIVEGNYAGGPGYWRFVLVHYDNPADEPPIPGPKPSAGFTYTNTGLDVTCTNTTTFGVTYAWDFGDGGTSTEANPTHTYAGVGIYIISLTATNPNGTSTSKHRAFIASTTPLTDAMLTGAPWHNIADNLTIFVGPAPGDDSWWSVSKAQLDGSSTGAEDWSCIVDDQFTFGAGGTFSYNTMGSTRNDGYFGSPNGCIDDAGIAASANGAPFGTFAGHSFTFTPASGTDKAKIVLTSPAGHAAFLGFYKGYNGVASGVKGGENNGTDPANFGSLTNTYTVLGYANTGTKEYLFVTVDITSDHAGTNAWSAILER